MSALGGKTIDELLAEKLSLDERNTAIKNQISEAKAHWAATGRYADPDWYSRATSAQRIIGRKSQTLQLRISQLRREEKAQNFATSQETGERFKHAFMRLVRERLGEAEYVELRDAAKREAEGS